MIQKMYSVKDVKAGAFFPPFLMENDETATRAMVHCLRDPDHKFSLNPEDFQLFYHGEFDNLTGELSVQSPIHVVSLHTISLKGVSDGSSTLGNES
jgi:hypothetical protein